MVRKAFAFLILVLAAVETHAAPRLAGIFADHMVLQRDEPLAIWGWADGGEAVTVSFAGQEATVVAADDGFWEITLAPVAAATSGRSLQVSTGDGKIILKDVLVGDVWHASGQSNMAMTVAETVTGLPAAEPLVDAANLATIRFCRISEGESREPLEDLRIPVKWTVCSPEAVGGFSAAAFFFARTIQREIGIPIGVIDSSRGGTPIEPFIPRAAYRGHSTLERELELGDREDLEAIWRLPGGVRARDANWLPGRLFHSRIAPIARLGVRGCVWYQGESNAGVQEDPRDYEHKMRALVQGWRKAFGDDELPFFYVQLPGSGAGAGWPYLREQQRLAGDLPHVGMVVTVDLEGEGIHPPNKVDVGWRLAAWALADPIGAVGPQAGPRLAGHEVRGSAMVVRFANADAGLMVARKHGLEPPQEIADAELGGFELLHEDGTWHPAKAEVMGTSVKVRCASVTQPRAARYAYAVTPDGSLLYNRDGYPASPFCTDPSVLRYDPDLPE